MNVEINTESIHSEVILRAGNWIIRPYSLEDADIIFHAYTDPSITYFMGREPFKEMQQAVSIIELMMHKMRHKKGIAWVVADQRDSTKLGHLGYWDIDATHCRAEIGYALLQPFQCRGIMTEVLPVVLDYGFNVLKLHSVFANTGVDNIASIKLLERNGFIREARFRENFKYRGKFLDSLIYSKLESDR